MAIIPQNDLSHELIKTILEEAAHEASLDDEGDVLSRVMALNSQYEAASLETGW